MNRIKRFFNTDFPQNSANVLPDLYAGDGQYVDVEISSESTLLTIRWEDFRQRHRITYSMALGVIMVHNSVPLESGN